MNRRYLISTELEPGSILVLDPVDDFTFRIITKTANMVTAIKIGYLPEILLNLRTLYGYLIKAENKDTPPTDLRQEFPEDIIYEITRMVESLNDDLSLAATEQYARESKA